MSEGYKVIWIPGIGKDKARHVVRTQPKAITVARLGSKYGIRVRDQDEEASVLDLRLSKQMCPVNTVCTPYHTERSGQT